VVKTIDGIFGSAVRKTRKYMGSVKLPGRFTVEKAKKLEHIRIKTYDRYLSEELRAIPRMFPDFERLHPFHRAIVEAYAPLDNIRQELGRLRALLKVLASVRDDALYRISQAKTFGELKRIRRMYLARVWDVLSKNKKSFEFLKELYRVVRRLPKVDFRAKTVVLAGFPNAGKSTMLRALTGSEPEIAPYPFTTKDIRLGHFEHRWQKVQVVDTPGLLDRPFGEMGPAEQRALAALKHLADVVVFVFDPLQDADTQRDLLTKVEKLIQVPVIKVVNKADLFEDPSRLEETFGADVVVSALGGQGIDGLKAKILEKLG